jgi:hypothetical protein
MSKRANVLLVHGAWADGSCWSKVILLLQAKGITVTAGQIPLTSLTDDIAVNRRAIRTSFRRPTLTRVGRWFEGSSVPDFI